jgi:hypothetical protein
VPIIRWFLRLLGTVADLYTLSTPAAAAIATGAILLMGSLSTAYALLEQLPLIIVVIFFVAGVLIAAGVVGGSVRLYRQHRAGEEGSGIAERRGEQEREQPEVSGEVNIDAGRDVINYGEIALVIQKFGVQTRTLTDKDIEAAVARIARYPGTVARVGAASGTPDGKKLSDKLFTVLQQAQWEVWSIGSMGLGSSEGPLPPGVLIDYTAAPDHAPFEELCQVLNDLGVQASLMSWGFFQPTVVVSDPG